MTMSLMPEDGCILFFFSLKYIVKWKQSSASNGKMIGTNVVATRLLTSNQTLAFLLTQRKHHFVLWLQA